MTGTVATQVKEIAFDRDIERLTEGFTGREWVFEEIDRWLQQGNERFFILTGEPGVGKSAISARLTQIRDDVAAYHFCIAGHSGTIEPNNVLLSLAAQLIEYFPGYAEALVNSIKPLRLSVNVEITIESIKDSTVQGVVINNLHTQNPQEALNVVLRQSLAALPNPPEQRRLILIDSLDEAITFSDRDNLVTLLAGLEDLPPWICLLLTSRPENRVLVEFEPLKPHRIEEMSAQNLVDIRKYVEKRIEQQTFQSCLKEAEVIPQMLIEEVTKLSSGNFLYTKLLLNDIEARRQSLDDLSALPKSIDDIYLAFLKRFKPQEWKNQYQPILGTLTVTQEPVTEDMLSNLTSLEPEQLRQDLGIIRQFLDVVENADGEETYAIFHQSLRDYLLNKKRNRYFWCNAQKQHERIVKYYQAGKNTWEEINWNQVDRYGLRYFATHLAETTKISNPSLQHQYTEQLVRLATNLEFQRVHQAQLQDMTALKGDMEQALRTVAVDYEPLALPLLVEMALAAVAFRRTWLSPEPIFQFAQQGNIKAAEKLLHLFTAEPEWRQATLLTIAWLAAQQNPTEARQLRDRIASNLPEKGALPLLLARLNVTLEGAALPTLALPSLPIDNTIQFIEEARSKLEASSRLVNVVAEQEAPLLVAYAVANPKEGDAYFKEYITSHATNTYTLYRNRSLWALLTAALQHPNQEWLQEILPTLCLIALNSNQIEFQEGFKSTLKGLRILAGDCEDQKDFENYRQQLKDSVAQLGNDRNRSFRENYKRRLAIAAQILALLMHKQDEATNLLIEALGVPYGYAGLEAPSCLMLAEAIRVCCPDDQERIQQALQAALTAAHNIQDATFCTQMTARVNALRKHWWGETLAKQDLEAIIKRLSKNPSSPEFATLHWIGEQYKHRVQDTENLAIPKGFTDASSLKEVAYLYQKSLAEVQQFNHKSGWEADRPLPQGTPVNIPDSDFVNMLTARLAAEVLVLPSISTSKRVELIQSLVPIAASDPTILDTVLTRLLLAARPTDIKVLDRLKKAADISLTRNTTSTALSSIQLGDDLASCIVKYMLTKNYEVFTGKKEYNIVYVEGMNKDGSLNENTPNKFNAVRIVIEITENIPKIVGIWEATTRPGSHYMINPMNPNGAPLIKFGQYQAWAIGYHGIQDGDEALLQVTEVSIHRCPNKDWVRVENTVETGIFGIHQQCGYDAPVNDIKNASAGCLVGRMRQGHREFMGLIKRDSRYLRNNHYVFVSTIISGDDLVQRFPISQG